MHTTSLLLAGLTSLASAAAIPDANAPLEPYYFHLKTRVVGGNTAFNSLYATSFHVGAGESAVVADSYKNVNKAQIFYINNTSVMQYVGTDPAAVPFGLSLPNQKPYNSTAPKAFNYVALNAGQGQKAASLQYDSSAASYVLSAGPNYPGPFHGPWVVCQVDGVSPYASVGPQKQILWKTNGGKTGAQFPKKCADVELLAVMAQPKQ